MFQEANTDKRQRFHIVQLAMFNAGVLASVQHEAESNVNGMCRKIIDQSATQNVASAPPAPSTINQSLFFGMAYLSLMWLRESLTTAEQEKALSSEKMKGVWDEASIQGPRTISNDMQRLKLVKNALSHGHVRIDEPFDFVFWDQNEYGKSKECSPTFLRMSSENLGKLANQFYFAVSDLIYKPEN